jgi:hypothetical protein
MLSSSTSSDSDPRPVVEMFTGSVPPSGTKFSL